MRRTLLAGGLAVGLAMSPAGAQESGFEALPDWAREAIDGILGGFEPAARPEGEPLPPLEPAVASDPTEQLITEVQQLLGALGYDPGPIDGELGPQTRGAIRAFLEDEGLEPVEEPSEALRDRLRFARAIASEAGRDPFPPFALSDPARDGRRTLE
jgi:hypothetical protein